MRSNLYATCSVVALAAALWLGGVSYVSGADAADPNERIATAFQPTRYVGFEGAFLLNDSDNTLSFDPEDEKFGDLDPLKPGDDGWQVGAEYGARVDALWDYRVGVNLIDLGAETEGGGELISTDEIFVGYPGAETQMRIAFADLELGYRPAIGSNLDLRIFGGLRGLYARASSTYWGSASGLPDPFPIDTDKLGDFQDETWAIGPRLGMAVAVPVIEERGISAVGSVAGAALFGERSTDYAFTSLIGLGTDRNERYSDSVTILNAEVMGGLNFALTSDAALTIGYRAQSFHNLAGSRSDVDKAGDYEGSGSGDVLVHGPFARMTIALD
ncbi:Lpg1974 family pore-forming outer membrane protein [Mesorhizobium sp. 10J20-29]